MRWIGKMKLPHDIYEFIEKEVIITKDGDFYNIDFYTIYPNNERHKDTEYGMVGKWSTSLGGAKRQINLDTNFKSKDWTWIKEE